MHYITLDFETYYDKKYSLKKLTYEEYIYNDLFFVHGVGIKIDNGPVNYYYKDIPAVLQELFSPGNDNVLICHRTMFDGAVLSWYYGLRPAKYYCTERIFKALWNQQNASLENMCLFLFPDDLTIRKGDELHQFEGVKTLTDEKQTVLGNYCTNDVNVTWTCFSKMWNWIPAEELEILNLTLKMFTEPVFILDRPRVEKHLEEVLENEKLKIESVAKYGLTREDLASNDKFAAWIQSKNIPFEKISSPTPKNPNNMKWPLAKDAEEFISIQTEFPEYAEVWEARLTVKSTIERTRSQRLLKHSKPNPLNPKGKIAMPLNYAAAHTLRWGGTNKINPQNFGQDSELRLALYAEDEYKVVVADASNIETRLLGWFAEDPIMTREFAAGEDLYCNFGTGVFGRIITKADEVERFVSKTCILGLGFQTGAKKLRKTLATGKMRLAFSLPECQRMVALYRSKYDRIPELWAMAEQWIRDMADPNTIPYKYKCIEIHPGRIKSPTGMYLNYPGLRQEIDENDMANGYSYWNGKYRTNIYGGKLIENIIQHLAGCILRNNIRDIDDLIRPDGGRIALLVHDETVSIVLTALAEYVFEQTKSIMRIPPKWASDGKLILDAEGVIAQNYGKH